MKYYYCNMGLEDLEKKLYKKKLEVKTDKDENKTAFQPKYEKTFLGKNWTISDKSSSDKSSLDEKIQIPIPNPKKILKLAITIAALFIVLGTAFAGFYLYSSLSAKQEVNFDIFVPINVLTGAPFNLKYNLSNASKNPLRNAEISIFLPDEMTAMENKTNKRVFTKSIGDLEPNAILNGEIPLIIFNNNKTVVNFDVSINYISGKDNKFEKTKSAEIIAKEPAVKLDLTAPEKIINNENFEINAQYSNISEYNFKKIRIIFDYPKNFSLKKTEPIFQNGYFETELPKNKEGKILISGLGQEQLAFLEIKSKIEALYGETWRQINEQSIRINFTPPPLSLKIESSAPDYAFPDNSLVYRLIYNNNSDIALNDVIIKAKLTGEMFEFLTLKTNGYYDSRNNTISWNTSNIADLKTISPQSGGSAEFSIKLKSYYPLRKISDKNFKISVSAEISSPTVPYNIAAEKTASLANLETKIGGQIAVEPIVYFAEPTARIINKGFLPPKVNYPINFTIHLAIKNYSNDAKNVSVKTTLASGVKFTGIIKSNSSSLPVYNERTGEISWSIDKIPATKGVISKPPTEAVFQIEITPNAMMVKNTVPLINETLITATDEFINEEIKNSAGPLTTADLSDWNFNSKNGIVVE